MDEATIVSIFVPSLFGCLVVPITMAMVNRAAQKYAYVHFHPPSGWDVEEIVVCTLEDCDKMEKAEGVFQCAPH